MGSFRIKLVTYFSLLAIIPTGVAFYGLDTFSKRREEHRIDSRLRSDIRFATSAYVQQVDASERRAQPVMLDAVLVRIRLALDPRDLLFAVQNSRIVAGAHAGQLLALAPGNPGPVEFSGAEYRGLLATSELRSSGARRESSSPRSHRARSSMPRSRPRAGGS